MAPSYVVVFKTHSWDAFVARQFERYRAAVGQGGLVIVVDETHGAVGPIPYHHVMRITEHQILALGLADAFPKGSLLWWNTDYPNYLCHERLDPYAYYMFVEYDSCARIDVDSFIAEVAARECDFVTLPIRQSRQSWYWTKFHRPVYDEAAICGSLNCISVYSARALRHLLQRRREMTALHHAGQLAFWPGNEVFVATEMMLAGFRCASLEDFGNAESYEWHPPILEADLPLHDKAVFLHPVLDPPRYIRSVLKFEFDLSSYFVAASPLRRQLARFPPRLYLQLLPGAFHRQVMVKLRQALGAV